MRPWYNHVATTFDIECRLDRQPIDNVFPCGFAYGTSSNPDVSTSKTCTTGEDNICLVSIPQNAQPYVITDVKYTGVLKPEDQWSDIASYVSELDVLLPEILIQGDLSGEGGSY